MTGKGLDLKLRQIKEEEDRLSSMMQDIFPAIKRKRHRVFHLGLLLILPLVFSVLSSSTDREEPEENLMERDVHRIVVSADQNWTDTGLDIEDGLEVYFRATGMISLQKGNPMAYCGPDGYNLKTVQQPLPDENIGALIGKVVHLVSVEIDEETGEEIRNEIEEEFFVGTEKRVTIPISGRLFLGINENVVGDNSGKYEVVLVFIGTTFGIFP